MLQEKDILRSLNRRIPRDGDEPEPSSRDSASTWTSELPTVPGWYWIRRRGYADAVVRVVDYGGELQLLCVGSFAPLAWPTTRCEWQGPIVSREEP